MITKIPNQQIFSFQPEKDFNKENFLISGSNLAAFNFIESWPEGWGDSKFSSIALLTGPKFSGKSFLAKIWQEMSNAAILDLNNINAQLQEEPRNIQSIFENIKDFQAFLIEDLSAKCLNENFLFHLINFCTQEKKFLLITSQHSIVDLKIKLPDLESRLNAIMHLQISQPDTELLASLILKHFSDFNLRISAEVLNFLVNRLERSYESINDFAHSINERALAEKKPVTIPMVKKVLES